MAKRITTQELSKGLRDAKIEAEGLITAYNKFLKDVEQTAELVKKTKDGLNFTDAKDLQKLNETLQQSNKLLEQRQDIDKGLAEQTKRKQAIDKEQLNISKQKGQRERDEIKLLVEKERLVQTNIRTQALKNRELEKSRKAQERENRSLLQTTNAYKKLSAQTNKAQAEFKQLAAEFGVNSKQAREALRRFNSLDSSLRTINNTARDGRRDVGRYGIALKGLGGNFSSLSKGLIGGLGVVGGVQAFSQVLREGFEVTRNFGLEISKVRAVTGATDAEFEKLKNNAIDLGSSTAFTASQVAELESAYAKLGFTTDEILSATEATLNLAIATDTDLQSAAEVAGTTLRAFGLDASDTVRVTDVMAKSFTSSALDIEKFRESIKLVAPIAKAAGVSIEVTTALLGKLADAGISGSIAGTSLRNLLGKLTDPTSELTKELGFAVDSSESLVSAFKQLSKGNIDLAKATELTDERSKAAFLTFVEGIDSVEALASELENASGSASEMARIVGDNLDGDIKKLTSAFEGLLLKGGVLDLVFRGLVNSATLFLGVVVAIPSAISLVVNGFNEFKEVVTESNLASKEFEDSLSGIIVESDILLERLKDGNITTFERTQIIRELNDKYGDYLDNLISESDSYTDIENAIKGANNELLRGFIIKQKEEELSVILKKQSEERAIILKSLVKETTELEKRRVALKELTNDLQRSGQLEEVTRKSNIENQIIEGEIDRLNQGNREAGFKTTALSLTRQNELLSDNAEEIRKNTSSLVERFESASSAVEFSESFVSTLRKNLSLVTNISQEEISQVDASYQRLLDLFNIGPEINLDLGDTNTSTDTGGGAELKEDEKRIREFNERVQQAKFESNQRLLEQEREFRKQVERIRIEQFRSNSVEEIEELERELKKIQLDRIEDVANEEIDLNNERIELVTEYSDVLEDEEIRLFNLRKDNEDQINKIKEANFKADLNRKKEELKAEKKNEEDSISSDENLKKIAEEREKALIDSSVALTDALINNRRKLSEEREREAEEDISEAQNRQKELLTLANSSNSQVSQIAAASLEQQRKIEREKTLELEAERKKQLNLQRLLAGLEAFKANVANDTGGDPVVKSLSQITSLITALSSFDTGIDSIGRTDSPVDNKGGMLAINHPGEMIIQEPLVKAMGNPSRYEVADVFKSFKEGNLVSKVPQNNYVVTSSRDPELISEIKGLRKDVKNSVSKTEHLPLDHLKGAMRYREKNGPRVNLYIYYV